MKNPLITHKYGNSNSESSSEPESYPDHLTSPSSRDIKLSEGDFERLQSVLQKTTLMADMTIHDILNKISVIYGYRALLAIRIPDDSEFRRHYDIMMDAVECIRQYAEFNRFYLGQVMQPSKWLALRSLVQESVASMSHRNVEIVIDIGNAEIYADELMKKVFTNLFENALSHGGDVSKIVILFSEDDEGALILIEDDGCGIPAENKCRIFEYGFGDHTGMGLFFSRRVLNLFGFSIREVGQEGCGARFEIRIPRDRYRCCIKS